MTEVTRSRSLRSTPGEVWEVLADLGSISAWAPAVVHSCLLGAQGAGPGAARRVQVGRTTLVERVLEWEPGSRLGYAIEGLPKVLRSVSNHWELAADGDGTTVALTTKVQVGPRPPQRLVERIVARRLGRESDAMLDGLAVHLGGAGAAA